MNRTMHILVTMDVEPVKQREIWTGPYDADFSERCIRGYWDVSGSFGYTPSFFVHPEAAALHPDLMLSCRGNGATLGLHVHAMKYRFPAYRHEFGGYDREGQREIISLAAAEWEAALGFRPRYFRPGAFSANDATAPVLAELGFVGGSLSIPGRIWPERYCVWSGVPPYPHRTHHAFRCAAGTMNFVDIPLTVDFDRPASTTAFFCYEDLRPTGRKSSPAELLEDIAARMERDEPTVPVIQLVTHNDQPFDDPSDPSRQRLEETLRRLPEICGRHGFVPVNASVEGITALVLAASAGEEQSWEQENEVRF